MIKTTSFELAEYARGDRRADKLAIVIPGRLDTKNYVHNTRLVDFLAGRGFYAISFDPPGTWESPGPIDFYTTTNCIKAVNELIELFGNRPTLVAGHSRGGTVGMLAGISNPHISHIISIFSSPGAPEDPEPERIVDGRVISYRDLPPGDSPTSEQQEFRLPLNYFVDGKGYNALPGLKNCSKPKLFFYAFDDDVVDPDGIREGYNVSAEPKMLHALRSDHDYRYSLEIMKEVNEVIGQFLNVHP